MTEHKKETPAAGWRNDWAELTAMVAEMDFKYSSHFLSPMVRETVVGPLKPHPAKCSEELDS